MGLNFRTFLQFILVLFQFFRKLFHEQNQNKIFKNLQKNSMVRQNLMSFRFKPCLWLSQNFFEMLAKYYPQAQPGFSNYSRNSRKVFLHRLKDVFFKKNIMLCAIWYHLHNIKNMRKHPWKSVTFSKVAGFSLSLFYVCFYVF